MSIRDFFGERLLKPSALGAPVQRIVFTTYAALVGLALALAFKAQLSGPKVPTYVGYDFHLGIFWVGTVAVTFAIIPLLAGAAHARTRWRYLIATPVLYAVLATVLAAPGGYMAQGGEPYRWMYFMPLPFVAAGTVLVALGKRWTTRTVLAISTVLATLFFAAVALTTWQTNTLFGQTTFFLIVGLASLALIPALLVVGFDLSEIAAEAGERVTGLLEKTPKLWRAMSLLLPLVGFAAAFLLFEKAGYARATGAYDTAVWFVLLLAGAAGVYAIKRRFLKDGSGHKAHINYLQAIVAAIVVFLIVLVATWFTEITPGYAAFEEPVPFSLKLPAGMTVDEQPGTFDPAHPVVPRFTMMAHRKPPTLAVTGIPHLWAAAGLTVKSVNDLTGIHSLSQMPLQFGAPDADGWARAQFTPHNKHGHQFRFFVLRWDDPTYFYRNAATWYLVCGGTVQQSQQVQSMCEAVRQSFSTGHYISDGYRQSRAAMLLSALLLLGMAAALLIYANGKPGRAPLLNFLGWAVFLTALRCAGGFLFGGVEHPLEDLDNAANLVAALLGVVAFAALVAALWPARWARELDLSQVRRVLDAALLGTLLMAAIFYLYVVAVGTGEQSAAIRGVIVVLVLSWELATAGSTLNPSHEHHKFPRASRVLIFAGYLVLVATCVLVFSGGTMEGKAVASFDTETFVANGILTLGGALILSRTLQRLAGLQAFVPDDLQPAEPILPAKP